MGDVEVLNNDFDPYQALINLDANVKNLIKAHNGLAKKVEEQQHMINILVDGLTAANKANEHLLMNLASDITEKLNTGK